MNWAEICENPLLRNLPYKIQTDKWGNLVMSPATNEHGIYQARIVQLLGKLRKKGMVISECSVQTPQGVKVADVAWASADFIARHRAATPYLEAPDICIEIVSPSNSRGEMEEKQALYFSMRASEVWFCLQEGSMRFFRPAAEIECSSLFPGFPKKIELYHPAPSRRRAIRS